MDKQQEKTIELKAGSLKISIKLIEEKGETAQIVNIGNKRGASLQII